MQTGHIAAHLLQIGWGLGAVLACGAVAFLSGLVLLPRPIATSASGGKLAGFAGAAAFVAFCWYGIGYWQPLSRLAPAYLLLTIVVAGLRHRSMTAALRAHVNASLLRWVALFAAFYLLAYLFTVPPATDEHLAPAWTGNVDLLTYARYAKFMLRPGTLRAVGADPWYNGHVYLQTPGVFYVLGTLSLFYHQDPLSATMTMAFGLSAVIGVIAAAMSRSVFGLSRGASVLVGAILISGPFYRYLLNTYFLSTFMALPAVLYLVWNAVEQRPRRSVDPVLALGSVAAYVLLLFTYSALFFVGIAAQFATVAVMLIAECLPGRGDTVSWRDVVRFAGRRAASVALPLVVLVVVLFDRVRWSVGEMQFLSRAGVAGWPLSLISPWAVLGWPGSLDNECAFCTGVQLVGKSSTVPGVLIFAGISLLLVALYFRWFRSETTPPQRALAAVAAGSFIAYAVMFVRQGESYQQWKFASYTALPWSFVAIAAVLHLLQRSRPSAAQPQVRASRIWRSGRAWTLVLTTLAIFGVGGNLWAHQTLDRALVTFPGSLRQLADLDRSTSFSELTVEMDETFDAFSSWLAVYFIPHKRLHVVSTRIAPAEKVSYEQISPQRPLLIQGFGCEGIGHDAVMPIADIGCLVSEPPSLVLNRSYPFNETFLFIQFSGLGRREQEGRWSIGPHVSFTLTADLKRAALYDRRFVNFQLKPFLPPQTTRQRVVVDWRRDRHGEITLTAPRTISLPVERADWSGIRMWTLPIAISLPDALLPPEMYTPRGQTGDAPLSVLFEDVSVTEQPKGTAVEADSGWSADADTAPSESSRRRSAIDRRP